MGTTLRAGVTIPQKRLDEVKPKSGFGAGLTATERDEATRRGRKLDETKPGSGLGLSIVAELVARLKSKGEGELAHVDVERLTEILSGKAAPGGAPPPAA